MSSRSSFPRNTLHWLAGGVLAAGLGLAGLETAVAADDLVVVVPEGTAKPAKLASDVAQWRRELGSSNVVFVDSLKREKPSGFAAMAVLDFTSASQMQAWQAANSGALGAPLQAVPVDVLTRGGAAPAAGSKPVYKISYYTLTSPRETFQTWVDGYLTPFLDVQVGHGILTRYAMYLEQGPSGRALLVLEYPDARTEAEAEPVKARLSDEIAKATPAYAQLSGLKEALRTTQSWTLAVPSN